MTKADLEYLALQAIDVARRGQVPEDNRVELKREWPGPPPAAARRLAALANAARGEDVVIVVGIDEKTGEAHPVVGEAAEWWSGLRKWFDGEVPSLTAWRTTEALLLGFDTTGGPYVVKTQQEPGVKGQPSHEVPWREGNETISARRRHLVQLLVPTVRVPDVEVLSGELRVDPTKQLPNWNATGKLSVFIAPQTRDRLAYLARRGQLKIETSASLDLCTTAPVIHFQQVQGSSISVVQGAMLNVDAPGLVEVGLAASLGANLSPVLPHLHIDLALNAVGSNAPTRLTAALAKVQGATSEWIWRL